MAILTALGMLGAGAALAADPPMDAAQGGMVQTCGGSLTMSWNDDGGIEEEDFLAFGSAAFVAWDRDRDGRVSRAEFAQCFERGEPMRFDGSEPVQWTLDKERDIGARTNYVFTVWDVNNDGQLSRGEFFNNRAFSSIDSNGDDVLMPSELWAAL